MKSIILIIGNKKLYTNQPKTLSVQPLSSSLIPVSHPMQAKKKGKKQFRQSRSRRSGSERRDPSKWQGGAGLLPYHRRSSDRTELGANVASTPIRSDQGFQPFFWGVDGKIPDFNIQRLLLNKSPKQLIFELSVIVCLLIKCRSYRKKSSQTLKKIKKNKKKIGLDNRHSSKPPHIHYQMRSKIRSDEAKKRRFWRSLGT